jgi:biotin operon repressor
LARVGKFIVRDSDINRVKLELITLFKDNPGTVDSAEKICIRLGRSKEEVEEALEQLTEHGICYRVSSRPVPIYMYYPSAQILQRIAELAPDMDYHAQMELVDKLLTRKKAK